MAYPISGLTPNSLAISRPSKFQADDVNSLYYDLTNPDPTVQNNGLVRLRQAIIDKPDLAASVLNKYFREAAGSEQDKAKQVAQWLQGSGQPSLTVGQTTTVLNLLPRQLQSAILKNFSQGNFRDQVFQGLISAGSKFIYDQSGFLWFGRIDTEAEQFDPNRDFILEPGNEGYKSDYDLEGSNGQSGRDNRLGEGEYFRSYLKLEVMADNESPKKGLVAAVGQDLARAAGSVDFQNSAAFVEFKAVLATDPALGMAYFYQLGCALKEAGYNQEAALIFKEILANLPAEAQTSPTAVDLRLNLANCYLTLGQAEKIGPLLTGLTGRIDAASQKRIGDFLQKAIEQLEAEGNYSAAYDLTRLALLLSPTDQDSLRLAQQLFKYAETPAKAFTDITAIKGQDFAFNASLDYAQSLPKNSGSNPADNFVLDFLQAPSVVLNRQQILSLTGTTSGSSSLQKAAQAKMILALRTEMKSQAEPYAYLYSLTASSDSLTSQAAWDILVTDFSSLPADLAKTVESEVKNKIATAYAKVSQRQENGQPNWSEKDSWSTLIHYQGLYSKIMLAKYSSQNLTAAEVANCQNNLDDFMKLYGNQMIVCGWQEIALPPAGQQILAEAAAVYQRAAQLGLDVSALKTQLENIAYAMYQNFSDLQYIPTHEGQVTYLYPGEYPCPTCNEQGIESDTGKDRLSFEKKDAHQLAILNPLGDERYFIQPDIQCVDYSIDMYVQFSRIFNRDFLGNQVEAVTVPDGTKINITDPDRANADFSFYAAGVSTSNLDDKIKIDPGPYSIIYDPADPATAGNKNKVKSGDLAGHWGKAELTNNPDDFGDFSMVCSVDSPTTFRTMGVSYPTTQVRIKDEPKQTDPKWRNGKVAVRLRPGFGELFDQFSAPPVIVKNN